MQQSRQEPDTIPLSTATKALIDRFERIPEKEQPTEDSRLDVSQTASFFALVYEKVRNAVEYREAHLLRRGAIERILKRRLVLNPVGEGEGENLLRELVWARYFSSEEIGGQDVAAIQKVLDAYIALKKLVLQNSPESEKAYFADFLVDLLTCEIEEVLSPKEARQSSLFTFFLYQVLKDKTRIEQVSEEEKNGYFYVALERTFTKSDDAYLRFHLFTLSYPYISRLTEAKLQELSQEFSMIAKRIDTLIHNPYTVRITRFIRGQMPPFQILFALFKEAGRQINTTLTKKTTLQQLVYKVCQEKYQLTKTRLRTLAAKAIIYIFLTKMIFILILEYPLSRLIYHEVNIATLAINTLFPPFLMFAIIGLTRIPGEENTRKIFSRIVDIIDADRSYEQAVSFVARFQKSKKSLRIFIFTVIYSMTYILTFYLLYATLHLLRFTLVSQLIFVFFVTIVSFFAYRIRQVAKEYALKEKESFFRPFLDFFFIPVLSVGKYLSSGLSQINIFKFIFDFIIEAPFKLIMEVIEEWIRFVRARRDEII